MSNGVKFDNNKIRYDLIPADMIHQLAIVYTYGAYKYEDDNWRKGMSWQRIIGSIERHYNAWKRGQDLDPDSGLPHLGQVVWGCFTLMTYAKTHPELDTRVKELEEGIDTSFFNLAKPKKISIDNKKDNAKIEKSGSGLYPKSKTREEILKNYGA